MKNLLRAFLLGVAVVAGAAGAGLTVEGIHAATISLFTGPAGTNPAANPGALSDLNTIINGVNNNAAFAGTGTPSALLSLNPVTTNTIGAGSNSYTLLQFVQGVNTTTTSTSGLCGIANAAGCFFIQDSNGIMHGIPYSK